MNDFEQEAEEILKKQTEVLDGIKTIVSGYREKVNAVKVKLAKLKEAQDGQDKLIAMHKAISPDNLSDTERAQYDLVTNNIKIMNEILQTGYAVIEQEVKELDQIVPKRSTES